MLSDDIARVARGDTAALERIYRASSAKLMGVCLRILEDRSEAEDVLHEVYLTVWRNAGAYAERRGSPMTWLSTIARNKSIDRLRSRGRRRTAPIEAADDVPDSAPGAAALVETGQTATQLDGCMGELDERTRMAIRTAFFEGATYPELSQRLQTPLGTVKSWVRRGLLKLKACLSR
jgi:RNA polymerase sigma-70 factor (ECF subfamily)